MIFTDLLNDLVARLQWDAYFSESEFPITVIGDSPIDWTAALETSLATKGVAGLISVRNVTPFERGLVAVRVLFDVHELPMINSRLANRKSALYVAVKAMSLWGNEWTPDEDVWNQMEFQGLTLTRLEKETGQITWSVEFRITTYLHTLPELFSSGGDVVFVNEDGAPLLNSPTEP